ncbi:hypothetical protein ACLSZV_09910, partial [Avibacterium gallinarum]
NNTSDELGISGKLFLCFWFVWIKENNLPRFERKITELRQKHCCGDKIKWQAAKLGLYYQQICSCEEERSYLNQCGVGRLDRDKNGVPYGKVCG